MDFIRIAVTRQITAALREFRTLFTGSFVSIFIFLILIVGLYSSFYQKISVTQINGPLLTALIGGIFGLMCINLALLPVTRYTEKFPAGELSFLLSMPVHYRDIYHYFIVKSSPDFPSPRFRVDALDAHHGGDKDKEIAYLAQYNFRELCNELIQSPSFIYFVQSFQNA